MDAVVQGGIGRRGSRFGCPAVEVHSTDFTDARLVVEREVPYGWAAQLHRTERRALPQHTEIESLVRQPDRNTVLDFGSTGIAYGRTVVVVDHAVAVHVFVDYIARLYSSPHAESTAAVHGVQAIGFVLVGDEMVEDVAEVLSHAAAGLVAPRAVASVVVDVADLVAEFHLVAGEGEVRADPVAEMLSDAAVPTELELDTAVVHDTRVDDRGGLSHDIGEAEFIVVFERGENVVAVLFEDVDREGQPLVEEFGVDTEVELACFLPCQRRVGEDTLDESGAVRFPVFAEIDVHVVVG